MQGWRAEIVASWSELMSNEEISIFGYLCSKTLIFQISKHSAVTQDSYILESEMMSSGSWGHAPLASTHT